jgi:hypothetical protein
MGAELHCVGTGKKVLLQQAQHAYTCPEQHVAALQQQAVPHPKHIVNETSDKTKP